MPTTSGFDFTFFSSLLLHLRTSVVTMQPLLVHPWIHFAAVVPHNAQWRSE
jgi:hypothetical protein